MKIPALLIACWLATTCARSAPAWRDGDIIFQSSHSGQSEAIQRATHSPYSHVGLIFLRAGKPYVFEAIATVRYTPLEAWIRRGDGGRYAVKRLKSSLSAEQVDRLRAAGTQFEGKSYDLYFEWSDQRIYCSELVWKMYHQALGVPLGELQKLHEFDLSDALVKEKLRERYGSEVPLEEPVISPARLFSSPLLIEIKD